MLTSFSGTEALCACWPQQSSQLVNHIVSHSLVFVCWRNRSFVFGRLLNSHCVCITSILRVYMPIQHLLEGCKHILWFKPSLFRLGRFSSMVLTKRMKKLARTLFYKKDYESWIYVYQSCVRKNKAESHACGCDLVVMIEALQASCPGSNPGVRTSLLHQLSAGVAKHGQRRRT